MNFAPYQWRAGEGYLPPPGSMALPIYPQPSYQPSPYYYAHYQQQPAPAPYGGYGYPAGPCLAIPPAKPAAPKSSAPPKPPTPPKKEEPKKAETVAHSLTAPSAPSVRPGVNYMYAPTHTKLHIFNKAAPVWDEKYKNQALGFKVFKVSTQFAVGEVIERVLKGKPETVEGSPKWAATEVVEAGSGEWLKGTTIEYGSDKAKGSLASMGWDERKGGEDIPPTWLVVHKL